MFWVMAAGLSQESEALKLRPWTRGWWGGQHVGSRASRCRGWWVWPVSLSEPASLPAVCCVSFTGAWKFFFWDLTGREGERDHAEGPLRSMS